MGDLPRKSEKSLYEEGYKRFIFLMKDEKLICRTRCSNPPQKVPQRWNLMDIVRRSDPKLNISHDLPQFLLHPAPECTRDEKEWGRFLKHIKQKDLVGIAGSGHYILPPEKASDFSHVRVVYKYSAQKQCESDVDTNEARPQRSLDPSDTCANSSTMSPSRNIDGDFARKDVCMEGRGQCNNEDNNMQYIKFLQSIGDHSYYKQTRGHQSHEVKKEPSFVENHVRAHPSYLQTLGQIHSGWIFGALAELVDNSRDAQASRLDISIEIIYSKRAGKNIPMLSVIDDGSGMTHQEVVRMTCLGHKQSDTNDVDRIGRFGVGFKTGAMRLGRDALVLTQTAKSRSIAFLSQSLNEGKDNLEIPIVSYCRKGQLMEVDTKVQSEDLAKQNLKAIKEFSPFDKYLIGEKTGLFCGKKTGTQIYIWNLDNWGSDCCLEWTAGLAGGSSFHQGDISIRSKRVRSRPGQMSRKVPLDYSLRSYLEVIFLVPRMKIYVQGSLVKSRPLAKSLSQTYEATGNILGKCVNLTLGRSQIDWEQRNCGIFLYWHGRLIEAFKRVGGMIHNGDVGQGVIGVIDVTELMDNGYGSVRVLNNKQGFQDCEAYAELEEWLGQKADEYWDKNHDSVELKKGGVLYVPDHEWVQCDKCRKWRVLSSEFDSKDLPKEWFCFMKPFNGLCETPEQKVEKGIITVSAKRTGYDEREDIREDTRITPEENDTKAKLKRLRKGPARVCKKTLF